MKDADRLGQHIVRGNFKREEKLPKIETKRPDQDQYTMGYSMPLRMRHCQRIKYDEPGKTKDTKQDRDLLQENLFTESPSVKPIKNQ